MRTFVIACGNTLRRDDGVAHRVVELLGPIPDSETRTPIQLAPELAAEIAGAETVIFIDADLGASALSVDELDPRSPRAAHRVISTLSHAAGPEEIAALSAACFGFAGKVFVCRIPVVDVTPGEGLTPETGALAAEAARRLAPLLFNVR